MELCIVFIITLTELRIDLKAYKKALLAVTE